jgi:putative zinc finger protein
VTQDLFCEECRALLAASQDGELDAAGEIAVRAHLEWCSPCATEAQSLMVVRQAVRRASRQRLRVLREDFPSVHTHVLTRVQVERSQSFAARVRAFLDDPYMAWVASGAALATAICLAALLGVVRLSYREAPQSMAAVIGAMADPGSDRNPIRLDGRVLAPSANPEALLMPVWMPGSEAVLALSAVVTREGRVRSLSLIDDDVTGAGNARLMEVLEAASRTQFEPARAGGSPVAVNMVWLLAHTTVVAKSAEEAPVTRTWRRPRETSAPAQPVSVPISRAPASRPIAWA